MSTRRTFIRKSVIGDAAVAVAPNLMGMPASSYRRIIGANERIRVGIVGLGRRLGGFYEPVAMKKSNVELVYLCDVMESQRTSAMENFAKYIDYKPKLENDVRKVIENRHYKAVAFYINFRGEVQVQKPAVIPQGLDWNLWHGPASRREYNQETWNYNWHWLDYGTAEAGNNGTHELDVARWAPSPPDNFAVPV